VRNRAQYHPTSSRTIAESRPQACHPMLREHATSKKPTPLASGPLRNDLWRPARADPNGGTIAESASVSFPDVRGIKRRHGRADGTAE